MSSYCFNREIHPEGLPQAYTIILLFRLLPESPNEPFAIWQITDRDYKPQVGVVLDRKDDFAYCAENLYITWLCMHSSQIFPKPKHSYVVKGLYVFSFISFFFYYYFILYINYFFQLRIIQLICFDFGITSKTKGMYIYVLMGQQDHLYMCLAV